MFMHNSVLTTNERNIYPIVYREKKGFLSGGKIPEGKSEKMGEIGRK